MATLRHKLGSFVERCLFVGPDDCQLLSDTQIASTSCVVVFRGLLPHFPFDLEVGVFLFQGPDVLQQSRAALVLLVPKRLLVGIETLLESLCSQAGVIPLVFSRNNGGLVDDGVNLAHTVQWASVVVPAIARLFAGRVFLDSSRTPHNRDVVLSNDSSHIRHATIAYLQGVRVEYFVQFRAPGEMLPGQGAESSAKVRCHILAKRRVEPCDLLWSVLPLPSHSALTFFASPIRSSREVDYIVLLSHKDQIIIYQ